jgi:ABC-2 type transport system permease protein
MTATDTPTTTEPAAPDGCAPGTSPTYRNERPAAGASFLTATAATSRRSVLQFFRTPQLLVMGTVQGALFLFMFRYVFGGAIGTQHGLSYVNFLVPGFLVTVILWTGMGASSGVAEDSATGVYDRLRSLPIPRLSVMVGRSIADAILVGWGVLVTGGIGFAVGFRFSGSAGAFAAGLVLIAGYAFSWVFITIGLMAGNAQAAQGMSILVVPFSFVSSANVPVSSMPGWMQPFAANQPISVIVNAVRSLMSGGAQAVGISHTTTYWVVLSLIWCAAIMLVFGTIATSRFAKMR